MFDAACFAGRYLLLRVWLAFECSGVSGMGLSIRMRSLMLNDLLIELFDHFIEFRMFFVFDSIVKTFNCADIIGPVIR